MFGSDSVIIQMASSLYDKVNFFFFFFSPNVFSYSCFACSVKLRILIMEYRASKDLDSVQFPYTVQFSLLQKDLCIQICV